MNFPKNCCDCESRTRCDAAMYTDKCHFYGPDDKPKGFDWKMLFHKIFA